MRFQRSNLPGSSGSLRLRCRRAPLAAALALCCAGFAQAATITVNDARGDVGNPLDGTCSLPDAIAALNTAAAFAGCAAGDGVNDRIVLSFDAATTIEFALPAPGDNNSALSIAKAVTIAGPLDPQRNPLVTLTRSAVSGTPNFRLIATTADLTLYGVALSNGNVAESGGAVRATGYASLSVSNSQANTNTASVSGGAVAVDCGALTLYRSVLSGNTASKNGGAAYVSDYSKSTSGGAPCAGSDMSIGQSSITNNTVTVGSGGGVFSFNGGATVTNSTISGNVTPVNGGGLYAYGKVVLTSSTVSNNTGQGGDGGGVWAYTANGSGSTISGNTAPAGRGGGIFAHDADLANFTVSNNSAQCGAGGVQVSADAKLAASTVANNSSGNSECQAAGGLGANNATVTNSTFTGNFGGNFGYGALYTNADMNLYFNTIVGNTAKPVSTRAGGVAFFGTATMFANIIAGNSSNDVYTFPAQTVSGGFNIVTTSNFATLPGDTIGNCSPSASLNLGPLADNGGPTQTMALLPGSCAFDAGPSTLPLPGGVTTDQRGFARPSGEMSDIGAFESQPDAIFANGFET